VPALILHGDDDQIVPISAPALLSSMIVKGAAVKICKRRASSSRSRAFARQAVQKIIEQPLQFEGEERKGRRGVPPRRT
jgi:hypothetical protein